MKQKQHTSAITTSRVIYGLLALSVLLYAYFLSLTFVHTVETRSATISAGEVKARLNALEREYVQVVHNLSPERALGYGLTTLTDPSHIDVPTTVAVQ